MSLEQLQPGEHKTQDPHRGRGPVKCHIPQRIANIRQRTTFVKPKEQLNLESMPMRPKSANRVKEDGPNRQPHFNLRSARQERDRPAPRRPSAIPKRGLNNIMLPATKAGRPVITVPIQRHQTRIIHGAKTGLPDQETIKKREELELRQSEFSNPAHVNDINEQESITSRSDKLVELELKWQEKTVQFEKMKNELTERQRHIMELYAKLRVTHQKLSAMGQKANLPPVDDLRIMNLSKLSPEQLLQLCTNTYHTQEAAAADCLARNSVAIDVNKIYNMPSKLVAACEQTLALRKEIVDWCESLQTVPKGIKMSIFSEKINNFKAENEILHSSLEKVKAELYKELNEIVEVIRKGVNETIALHLRTEELTYKLSELNSQNTDMRKQMHFTDHLKMHNNKHKIEELEKELKEEKAKKMIIKGKLTRAQGQAKSTTERTSQLEAALEQARSQNWTLERTIQQLRDKNQKLQVYFDKELSKLTEAIRENTVHLEEIAEDREKLQTEKEELEKHLSELSGHYNEALEKLKHETSVNVSKILDADKKYEIAIDEKQNLEEKTASLCAQLLESELRNKDLCKQLQERETQLSKTLSYEKELEICKRDIDSANVEIEDYKSQLTQQKESIKQIETNFKEALNLGEDLKRELHNKDEYVVKLENNQSLLQRQLQQSEQKMGSYEEQLSLLKNHIKKLQEDFGEYENIHELRNLVNQQRAQLLEATRQNGELAEALQNKDTELASYLENIADQEQLLVERDGIIKIITEKEEQQANLITTLQNNLEISTQADSHLNQHLADKNNEINTLLTTLETRKQQISEFEKIILTLEDQMHKANEQISQLEKIILSLEQQTQKDSLQKRFDQDKILFLENKLKEYELNKIQNKRNTGSSSIDNLDNLIKVLENELEMPLDSRFNNMEQAFTAKRKLEKNYCQDTPALCHSEPETKIPTKIVMGNYVKKTYITNEDKSNYQGDNLDRKKAITNINPQKFSNLGTNVSETTYLNRETPPFFKEVVPTDITKEHFLSRNIRYLISDQSNQGKKNKMFKLAGHRL